MKFIAFVSAVLVVTIAWTAIVATTPYPNESAWISDIYQIKESAAARIERPKIVLVGGSAMHFNFSAARISMATGMPTVNLGSHAALGIDYIIHRAKRSLRRGDTVVLLVEPGLTARDWRPTTILASYALRGDIRYLASAPLSDVPGVLYGEGPVATLQYQLQRLIPTFTPHYRASSLDRDTGDETSHAPEAVLPHMVSAVEAAPPYSNELPTDRHRLWPIHDFGVWLKEHDISAFYVWTPTYRRQAYGTDSYGSYFAAQRRLFTDAGFTVIGAPEDYMVDIGLMFDSSYHLNTRGAAVVSDFVAGQLALRRH